MAEENIDPGQQKIIDLLSQMASDRRDDKEQAKTEKEAKARKKNIINNTKSLIDNTTGIFGLTSSMFTLRGMMGDLKGMNSQVIKSLAQVNKASEGSNKTLTRFDNSNTGLAQQIETFGDAVGLGMSTFSDDTLKFATQLKAQGINQKAALSAIRNNTQVLGMSEAASLALSDSLISTAAENGDSIEGLIGAIESMKDAMVSTTVALGPQAAENMQKVAAMIGQHNSGLQEAATKFVSSFLSGEEGFLKAAQLGVQFTGEESTEEFAGKIDQLMGKIVDYTAGMKGAGSQPALEAILDGFGLSMEDINLAQQLEGSNWAKSLVQGQTDQRQLDLSKKSLDQAHLNAVRNGQKSALEVTQGIAETLDKVGKWGDGYFMPMVGLLTSILKGVGTLILAQALGSLGGGKGRLVGTNLLKKIPGVSRVGKMFSSLGKRMRGFGHKMKYASKVFSKNLLGMFKGKGSLTLLKKAGGTLAKGAGKLLGPLAAVATGVMKANEPGKNWVDGLKRGLTSAAIWGVGALAAPLTGGASLLAAAAIDAALGDKISEALPGGQKSENEIDKKENKRTTEELAKQTKTSMLELAVTQEAGYTAEELSRIQANTLKNLEYEEDLRNMTTDLLLMKKAELEENRATPITAITGFLARNIASMNTLITQTELANEQRGEQTAVIEQGPPGTHEPFAVGGGI